MLFLGFFGGNLLHVHLEAGGDVGGVGQVPAAVEALGVGVGAAGDGRLSRRSCTQTTTGMFGYNKKKRETNCTFLFF